MVMPCPVKAFDYTCQCKDVTSISHKLFLLPLLEVYRVKTVP
jgi:hypothetical protein